ncbi:MAG: hypothetical protein IPG91_14690 [Ideonella sp.]|nr:hypothetical protein [Ideonella sp.]
MQVTVQTQAAFTKSGPASIAPELLKLIGGGVAQPTSSPTPLAPKSKW